MKTLVLGGTGFIGMHVARELAARGEEIVIAGARAERSPAELKEFFGEAPQQERIDLTVSYDVFDAIARIKPDKVFDASGYAPKSMSPAREVHLRTACALNVIEACRIMNVGQLTITSSSDIYWGLDSKYYPYSEAGPIAITEQKDHHYIQAGPKKLLEAIAAIFQRQTELDIRIVRIDGTYGPLYNKMINVVARMVHAAVRGVAMDLTSDKGRLPCADMAWDFNYVKDHAYGMALVHQAIAPEHKVYNVGSGKTTRLDEFADAVNALFPGAIPPLPLHPHGPSSDQRYLDITRVRALGYEPRWSVATGVADYVQWLQSHDV
ncbi:NAD-dependent epimerase/dehydratase family protein [Paraburkholderia sp. 40]|uniref:NAD-dependent epimerase/dehydratase family protein n=1 Tax=Paraburkholderia sp. 40 TaxID=2991059 RepID=UPI003D19BDCA